MLGFTSISETPIAGLTTTHSAVVFDFLGGAVAGGYDSLLYGRVFTSDGGAVAEGNDAFLFGKVLGFSAGVVTGGNNVLTFGNVQSLSGGVVAGGNTLFINGWILGVYGGCVVGGDVPVIVDIWLKQQLYVSGSFLVPGVDYGLYSPDILNNLLTPVSGYDLFTAKVIFVLDPAKVRFAKS